MRLVYQVPTVSTYRALRQGAGLSGKTATAAELGLPNSLFAVQVLHGDLPIGMGRVIGDGGCFFQVVDIAVLKEFQGQGVGKMIMGAIRAFIDQHVPASGYVSLIADGEADRLYQQFGFRHTAPRSVGMALYIRPSPTDDPIEPALEPARAPRQPGAE